MIATATQALIGQVASDLSQLPEEDLTLVAEFVGYLVQSRREGHHIHRSVADIRSEAKRRAGLLVGVPRSEIVARFEQLSKEVRQEATTRGTAIEGDLVSD